jgi:hypothetical protein
MSVPKALAKMWRDEGWRGFMAGNGTNCIRIVPYSAVQFGAYNVYKRVSICIFYARDLPAAGPILLSILLALVPSAWICDIGLGWAGNGLYDGDVSGYGRQSKAEIGCCWGWRRRRGNKDLGNKGLCHCS